MSVSSSSAAPTQPENRISRLSHLCSAGPRPLLMTGILLEILKHHFASAEQIEQPSIKGAVWSADLGDKLLITTNSQWKPGQANYRPALVVKRNGWRVNRLGINDIHMGTINRDGVDRFSTFVQGSHTVFCYAKHGGTCERLAGEVYRELIQFGPRIRRELMLQRFVIAEVGPLAEVAEAAEHYAVPVTLAYAFEEMWITTPHTPKLKRVEFEIDT